MAEQGTTVFPRLDTGFEAALDGNREAAARALHHAPLIELMNALAQRIMTVPATSQAEVIEYLIPHVSAWSQVEHGWMVFDRLSWGTPGIGVAAAEFLGEATDWDEPAVLSFGSHALAGFRAGWEMEEKRQRYLSRVSPESSEFVLEALEAAPDRGEGALSWMIGVVSRFPTTNPAVLAEAFEARFGTSDRYSQPLEVLRLLGYEQVWRDPRSGFLADCVRLALRLGDTSKSISRSELELSHKEPLSLPHEVRDEDFATDVLHALTNRIGCMLPPDSLLRLPHTLDRNLFLIRLSKVLAEVSVGRRTESVCDAMLALLQTRTAAMHQEAYRLFCVAMPIYERGIGRRRRRYLAYLLGWIPVTVLWSVGTVDLPEAVQHFLWPVFICLSARALRALAKFRAIVDVWRSSAVSLLYVAGYVAGWILIGGEASGATALASRITLGAVLSASAGFLTALVSISVPSRIESAVVEGLPEGLPDDWKDSAAEELSTLRDSTRPPK